MARIWICRVVPLPYERRFPQSLQCRETIQRALDRERVVGTGFEHEE